MVRANGHMALIFRTLRFPGTNGVEVFPSVWVDEGHFVWGNSDYLAVYLV
jgi:hypothetical protein